MNTDQLALFIEVIDEQLNARTYISFLKSVLTATRSHLMLIQDGAKYHHSAEFMSFLDDKKRRVTPHKLPAYSPDLNPIEGLWKKIKVKGTHLVYFDSFDKLMDKVAATALWFAKRPDEVLPLFGSYAGNKTIFLVSRGFVSSRIKEILASGKP